MSRFGRGLGVVAVHDNSDYHHYHHNHHIHLKTWAMTVEASQIVGTSFETNQKQNRLIKRTRLAQGGFSVLFPRYVLLNSQR